MRTRLVAIGVAAATGLISAAASAEAAKPGPRPQLTIGSLTGPHEGPDGSPEWTLAVDAVDADGVIWEVAVHFGDGGITWATTFCLQGGVPGTAAHLEIPHTYAEPGRYRVQVEATSVPGCFGEGGDEQTSRPVTKIFTVTG